jgi:K+-transporting ATPase KdpF subunit
MTLELWIGLALSIASLVYLVYSKLRPEHF